MWTLLGIAVLVAGFAVRLNPLIVIALAVAVTGLFAHLTPIHILEVFGKSFNASRYIAIVFTVLPLIGLLERHGLQEQAKVLIGRLKTATVGRLLLAYLLFRQVTVAFGLPIGGPAQMVRPLLAPMAEGAAEKQAPDLSETEREKIKAMAAATDNVATFFGEDIFIAVASVLLIKGFLEANKIIVQPLEISLWAIPTAILAFFIHGARLLLIDRRLRGRNS
jgi:uncharacterized membrane protein